MAITFGAAQTTQSTVVHAKSNSYMKTLNLKWDLKKGKNLTVTAAYPGIGKQKFSVKMTSYKLQNASKKGYKKLTIGYKSTRKWTLTKKKVDKIINTSYKKMKRDYIYCPFVGDYAIVDYNTGVSLEGKNDYDVKMKYSKVKTSGTKKYKGTNGNWIKFPKTVTFNIQITYPEDYTGLCIGFLGINSNGNVGKSFTAIYDGEYSAGDIDEEYFKATKWTKIKKNKYKEDENGTPFRYGQTSYYLKGQKNSHWLLIK